MSVPVILRPEAEADVQTIHVALEAEREGLGRKFAVRLRQVLERIESMPEMYGVVWHDVRAARVKPFRYVAYYVPFTDRVEVIAIMHGSRNAPAWRSRM